MTGPQPYLPEGFDEFWRSTVAEAGAASIDYHIDPDPVVPTPTDEGQTNPGQISKAHDIRTFRFRGIGGDTLNGWIATPLEVRTNVPGFLWVAPYGRESVMPNQYGTRPGFASLSFNFFGKGAFHQERYRPESGYFAQGVLDKSTWVFRSMFQNAVLGLRVLADLPHVDADKIGSMGMSQGGGMSIWLGAWSDRVKAVCADMPFLGAMHETLLKNVYRYPLKELMDFMQGVEDGERKVLETIGFFDTLNQATRCSKPTLVSVGLKDPAVKPIQVQSIYAALPGRKLLKTYDWGHDWHTDMIENNRAWLLENVRGSGT